MRIKKRHILSFRISHYCLSIACGIAITTVVAFAAHRTPHEQMLAQRTPLEKALEHCPTHWRIYMSDAAVSRLAIHYRSTGIRRTVISSRHERTWPAITATRPTYVIVRHAVGWPLSCFEGWSLHEADRSGIGDWRTQREESYWSIILEPQRDRVHGRKIDLFSDPEANIGLPKPMPKYDTIIPCKPIWLGLIVNSMFFGLTVWSGFLTLTLVVRISRKRSGRCARCGYAIDGLSICPECGMAS